MTTAWHSILTPRTSTRLKKTPPKSNLVIYNYFFNGEETAKDVDGFVFTLEKILQLCEMWSERITDSLSAGVEKQPMEQCQYSDKNIFA